jgi:hypothetical protein
MKRASRWTDVTWIEVRYPNGTWIESRAGHEGAVFLLTKIAAHVDPSCEFGVFAKRAGRQIGQKVRFGDFASEHRALEAGKRIAFDLASDLPPHDSEIHSPSRPFAGRREGNMIESEHCPFCVARNGNVATCAHCAFRRDPYVQGLRGASDKPWPFPIRSPLHEVSEADRERLRDYYDQHVGPYVGKREPIDSTEALEPDPVLSDVPGVLVLPANATIQILSPSSEAEAAVWSWDRLTLSGKLGDAGMRLRGILEACPCGTLVAACQWHEGACVSVNDCPCPRCHPPKALDKPSGPKPYITEEELAIGRARFMPFDELEERKPIFSRADIEAAIERGRDAYARAPGIMMRAKSFPDLIQALLGGLGSDKQAPDPFVVGLEDRASEGLTKAKDALETLAATVEGSEASSTCDTCNGDGAIDEHYEVGPSLMVSRVPCPDCNGSGKVSS